MLLTMLGVGHFLAGCATSCSTRYVLDVSLRCSSLIAFQAFKLIQLVLEHRLWWVALFGLPPCLLLASQTLSSTTASKFLLLVAVVIHRVLCSTLFLSLPLITGSALSNARRLVAPQQLLMLFLFPMLCFAEKIHAMIVRALCLLLPGPSLTRSSTYMLYALSRRLSWSGGTSLSMSLEHREYTDLRNRMKWAQLARLRHNALPQL